LLQRKTSSAGSSRLGGAGSDGRRSLGARSAGTGSSDSGAGSDKGSQLNPSGAGDGKQLSLAAVNMASMYDSLAAELREKLGGAKQQPLLLPPRDYDTVHRSRGNIVGIEARRSLNPRIVGGVAATTATGNVGVGETTAWNGGRIDHNSSGHSSGIGSDTAPSPPLQEFSPDPDDGRSSSGKVFARD